MQSPTQCPKCRSAKVVNALERHRQEYSWWNITECFVWIIFIPLGFALIAKRYDQPPDPQDLICLDCKFMWEFEDD